VLLWLMQALAALVKVWRSLCTDAAEAAEQPLEFSLLVCLLVTVVDAIVALASAAIRRCCCASGCWLRLVEDLVPTPFSTPFRWETPLFAPFIYKMHRFTKTGSGQT
jgi:hypothetical protein